MNDKYVRLASEIKEIQSILSMIPEENIIERIAFESRLSALNSELAITPKTAECEKIKITFRGTPVFGSHGMLANFGSKAMSAFSDAFASVIASADESVTLKEEGRLPDVVKNQLYITGIATGSFGFELEIPRKDEASTISDATNVMKSIVDLLEASTSGTDDDVTNLVEDIHPRAVTKINEFLSYLVKNQAWCGFQVGEKLFRYDDVEALKHSVERLHERNIEIGSAKLMGEFLGVLPKTRYFEFKPAGQDLIKGRIDHAIEDPDIINRSWLYRPVEIQLHTMRVGAGRPRYRLVELPRRGF